MWSTRSTGVACGAASLASRLSTTRVWMMAERSDAQSVVYVIDDDVAVREALSGLLRSVGLQVKTFAAPPEFLASKLADVPSCLVLDVRLPGHSGLEFQTELAKANIHVPIIFITGHGDIPMSVKAMKAGAVEFLTKPFRDQDLLDAVQAGLDRDRAWRDRAAVDAELRDRFEQLYPPRAGGDGLSWPACSTSRSRPRWDYPRSPSRFIAATSCGRWAPSRWPSWCEWRMLLGVRHTKS